MKRKIIISFVAFITVLLVVYTIKNIQIANLVKDVFICSYESYGEVVPEKYKDIISEDLFLVMNHREKSDNIAGEDNDVKISYVTSNFKNARVILHYRYRTYDSEGNDYIGTTGDISVEIQLTKQNGQWVIIKYIEDP